MTATSEVEHDCQQDLRAAHQALGLCWCGGAPSIEEAIALNTTVAALYVDPNGVYASLPGVEVWDEARDARLYAGPWPVVAHPPCARWCRLAGFVEARFGYMRG